jgi:hypothetical protein
MGLLPPPIEPCVRFSLTRLTDVFHRRHSALPATAGSVWHDDASVEVDQAIRFGDS